MKWSFLKKLGFIFLFSYAVLYANSSQFIFAGIFELLWQKIVPWFANLVGHTSEISTAPNGSGDTTYDYYKIFLFAVLSVIAAVVATSIDYKRANYKTLTKWLTVFLRYYLASQMISYGLAKIYYMQFSFPSPMRLDQPLGDFSPMGLLWTFMGYSQGYTVFTGIMEFVGGILLLSRRTALLGALTSFGVMLNVMMLNYCYDVPVKLLSTHLVLIALFLILQHGQRLFRFFFTSQAVEASRTDDIVPPKYQKAKDITKWVLLIAYLGFSFYQTGQMSKIYGPNAPKPLFYGKYIVEEFTSYNDTLGINKISDVNEWSTFYQSWEGYAAVKTVLDSTFYYNFEPDTTQQLFRYKLRKDSIFTELKYEQLDSLRYHVYGKRAQDSLDFKLKKVNQKDYLLVNRGFNWINESPYNR